MATRKLQPVNPIHGRGKNYFEKVKPRAALGTLSTNLVERQPVVEKDAKKHVKTLLPPKISRTPEVEEMEVVEITTQLSQQLYIDDIDVIDNDNPQLCAEYVKEIYSYMMTLEKKYHVPPTYFETHPVINSRRRALLIDWLIEVHQRFNLLQETLYLTVSIIDRYFELKQVNKSELQLVGITAMLIASKYEEMYAPEVKDFVFISDDTFTSEQIRSMEVTMLRELNYSLGTPLCLHFLRRYSRAGEVTPQIHTMGKFLMELCLPEYSMLEFVPSQLAASALFVARLVYDTPEWTPTLQHYTTYTADDIMPCVCKLAQLVQNMTKAKQQAVRTKYSSRKLMRTASVVGLFSEDMQKLASMAT